MYLFIATIFIAEIIIALTLIALIVKADRLVLEMNQNVSIAALKVRIALLQLEEFVVVFGEKTALFFDFVRKKRDKYIFKILNTLLFSFILFILRSKCKKISRICKGVNIAKSLIDSFLA